MKAIHKRLFLLFIFSLFLCACLAQPNNKDRLKSLLAVANPNLKANLEVPIEMVDSGLHGPSSIGGGYQLSQTPLNTEDYDGEVSYTFEITAANNTGSIYDVSIIDSNSVVMATIAVPIGSTNPVYYTVPFIPNPGSDIYRVALGNSGNSFNLYVARIRVRQIGATKTKIYIPLLAATYSASSYMDSLSFGGVDHTTSSSYVQANAENYSIWKKDSSSFSHLAAGTPWTFTIILGNSDASSQVLASLFNRTSGNQISDSELSTTSSSISVLSTSFADGALNFDSGSEMEVRIASPGGSATAYLAKAGLSVQLDPIAQAEVYFRYGRQNSTAGNFEYQRMFFDPSFFSLPQFYHESVGHDGSSVDPGNITSILDSGTAISGTSGSDIAGSSLSFGNTVHSRARSSSFDISEASNLIQSLSVGNTINVTSDLLVVQLKGQ